MCLATATPIPGEVIIQGLAGHTQCVPDDSVCNAQDSEVGVDDTPIHGLLGYWWC